MKAPHFVLPLMFLACTALSQAQDKQGGAFKLESALKPAPSRPRLVWFVDDPCSGDFPCRCGCLVG